MKVAILSGSVYGTAEEVARHAAGLLNAAGFEAWHNPRATLADVQAFAPEAFLAVTSTTGMGELPDNLQPLYSSIRARPACLAGRNRRGHRSCESARRRDRGRAPTRRIGRDLDDSPGTSHARSGNSLRTPVDV